MRKKYKPLLTRAKALVKDNIPGYKPCHIWIFAFGVPGSVTVYRGGGFEGGLAVSRSTLQFLDGIGATQIWLASLERGEDPQCFKITVIDRKELAT